MKFPFTLLFCISLLHIAVKAQTGEFNGPFASWTNLRTVYNAKGDGRNDDTKALQKALDSLGEKEHSPVLYIPAGTYVITSTLQMKSKWGISIIGEDPLKTIIKWNGAKDGKMLYLNGVAYSQFSRLKWDGNNSAAVAYAHEWDGRTPYANSGTEHSDEIFYRVGTGIKSGANMDAELTILRCRFYDCSQTGVSLQGWNALDWFIWDSYFENCNRGVSNTLPQRGAGNFHVYRSGFVNNNIDIELGNSMFFSFRDNVSYGSNKFLVAMQYSNSSLFTLQGNYILEAKQHPSINLFTKGNVLMMDNYIRSKPEIKSPVVRYINGFAGRTPDFISIGNRYTADLKKALVHNTRIIEVDDLTVPFESVKKSKPAPVPFLPFVKRKILEADGKMKSADIQSLLNQAAKMGKNAIVHFRYGTYNLDKSIQIPKAGNIQLIGDGLNSRLFWKGEEGNEMIVIPTGTHINVSSLYLDGGKKGNCILVEESDRKGDRIYGNQVIIHNMQQSAVVVDKIENTRLQFESFFHNYQKGVSVKVTGTGNNIPLNGLNIYGGESADNPISYQVLKGGRIMVQDAWYESGSQSGFLDLQDKGEFILNGAMIAATNAKKDEFINIKDFDGKVSISQTIMNAHNKTISITDSKGLSEVLLLGNLNWADSLNLERTPAKGQFGFVNNRYNTTKGSFANRNIGSTDPEFIKKMLKRVREDRPEFIIPLSSKNADIRFYRVMMEQGVNGLKIIRSGQQNHS